MNWPNILTLSRVFVAVLMVILLSKRTLIGDVTAALFFLIASITDYYDGYLAKKQGLISDFGKIMDPIADKVLILTVLGMMVVIGVISWWMVVLIAVREIVITIDRLLLMKKGMVIAAEMAGKIKTVLQMAAVSTMLIYLIWQDLYSNQAGFVEYQRYFMLFIQFLMSLAVVITIYSGISYFQNKGKSA